MSSKPELLTSSQAAELLGVWRSTVNRWVTSGQLLPYVTTGAGHLFDAEDIRALAGRMEPKQSTPT